MTAATAPRAHISLSGEGNQMTVLGLTAFEKIRSSGTGGIYAFEVISPAGQGVPPHTHSREDEVLYVIEGDLAITLGGEQFYAGAGSVLNFPRGMQHSFQGVGETASRVLHVMTPGASFEQFFHELAQLPPGPPDMPTLVALFGKYGMELLPPEM